VASSVSGATGTSVTVFVDNVYIGATPAPTAPTAIIAVPTRAPTPVPTAPPATPPPTRQPSTAPTAASPTAAPPTGAPATAAPTTAPQVVVPADPTTAPTTLPTAALTPAPTSNRQPLPAGATETEGQATSALVVVLIICGAVFLVGWFGVVVLVRFGCRKSIRRSKQEESQRVLNAPQQSPRLPRLPPPRRPPTQLPGRGPPAVSPRVPPRASPRVEWDMDKQV
jgi:hypothetical protein